MLRFTLAIWLCLSTFSTAQLPGLRLTADGKHFETTTGEAFRVWGVNYDHDDAGLLIEDYWASDWPRVVEDMQEIKDLGANVVRIHLQVAKFMTDADTLNPESLAKLKELLKLSEQQGLYLDITGLGCYHKADVPAWYHHVDEAERWRVQANFWRGVAATCKDSPAVFCYDLMNEPIMAGDKPESEWLTGELGGKFFVQRITRDMQGRPREQVAEAWVKQLTEAIRSVDGKHLITVGEIPWSHVFPGAKPVFYAPSPAKYLDFVSIHIYPKANELPKAIDALTVYRLGKPLVIEEFFPLSCSIDEARQFIHTVDTDGIVSFYWGKTIAQYQADKDLKGALISSWLEAFQAEGSALKKNPTKN